MPVIIPASPPVMNSFGLTPVLCSNDLGRAIGHARYGEHGAARYGADGIVREHSGQGGRAVFGRLCDVAGLAHERFAHHVNAGSDQASQVLATGIHAVDLDGRTCVHDAQRRTGQGPGTDQSQPPVGAQQRRIQIAIGEPVEIVCRGHEFKRRGERSFSQA